MNIVTRAVLFLFIYSFSSMVCSETTYRFYDGANKPSSQIALVSLPPEIDLIMIDGKDVSSKFGLFRRGNVKIALNPGHHRFVLQYSQIWDIDADEHEKIKSLEVEIRSTLEKNHEYKFSFDIPETLEEARKVQENFLVTLTDVKTNKTITSKLKNPADGLNLTRLKKDEPAPQNTPLPPSANDNLPLQMLKHWWAQSSDEDKKAFLLWADQP